MQPCEIVISIASAFRLPERRSQTRRTSRRFRREVLRALIWQCEGRGSSARRHSISPCRDRLVKGSEQRRGFVWHQLRPHWLCRRCATDASQESVGNTGTIYVTTTDNPLVIDSVQRCEG